MRISSQQSTRRLDDKGRCCGAKPIFYKGGSWRSPVDAPLHFCSRCGRSYRVDGQMIIRFTT